jgi:hypothetical protein
MEAVSPSDTSKQTYNQNEVKIQKTIFFNKNRRENLNTYNFPSFSPRLHLLT